jgi:hypothetical protein
VPGPLPEVLSFSPTAGAAGTPVTIKGSELDHATFVRFTNVYALATVVSNTEITTRVPAGARTGPLVVITTYGVDASDELFIVAPNIDSFSPSQAPIGSSVSIRGFNFTATSDVLFNEVPATFVVPNDTEILTTVPIGATDGPITVINPGGSDVSDTPFQVRHAPGGPGINLAWDDCGEAGTELHTFACNDNSGAPFTLIASYRPPAGLTEFLGMSAEMLIATESASLPNWWKHGAGHCRGMTGLATNFDFTAGPFNCFDFFVGQAAGGFAYDVEYLNPNQARLRVQCAVPFDNRGEIDPSLEWYAFKVLLLRAKTTGTGSCSGCDIPACILLNEIQLFQPPDLANDPVISTPLIRNRVYWHSIGRCAELTPVLVSVMTAEATADRVHLIWQTEDVERATIHRREGEGEWRYLATVLPDGQRRIHYEDTDVTPGVTYDYRLGIPVPAGEMYVGETRVTVPMTEVVDLGLSRVAWHAGSRSLVLSLTLPHAGSASLELFDVNGRRVEATRLDGLEAGHNDLSVRPAHPLTPGVFFARLMLDGEGVSRRFVVVQ